MIFTSSSCSSRMLKKSASGVLASLRGSTYRSVRLASSLAAALLDGLFEHPEGVLDAGSPCSRGDGDDQQSAGHEFQGHAVDAVTKTGGLRPIFKHVALVT